MSSLSISGTGYKIRPWPQFIIKPAILWAQSSSGYWTGSDRGAAQDIYESNFTVQTTDTTMNALQTAINAARESITLSGFNTDIFSPNVDQTGSITASIIDFGERQQLKFATSSTSVHSLELTFRAIAPTLLGTTPSLSTLRLQEGWTGDHTYEVAKAFSQNQTAFYADRKSDIGKFTGMFSQTTTELKAILAYILVTARASSFTFPTFAGVTYPFGVARGSGPFNCRIKDFKISRKNLNRWALMIEFVEAA